MKGNMRPFGWVILFSSLVLAEMTSIGITGMDTNRVKAEFSETANASSGGPYLVIVWKVEKKLTTITPSTPTTETSTSTEEPSTSSPTEEPSTNSPTEEPSTNSPTEEKSRRLLSVVGEADDDYYSYLGYNIVDHNLDSSSSDQHVARSVQVYTDEDFTYTAVCTGTIINADTVLTTVTCANLAGSDLMISTSLDLTASTVRRRAVKSVSRFWGYSPTTFQYNVAKLKLNTSLELLSKGIEALNTTTLRPAINTTCVNYFWPGIMWQDEPYSENRTVQQCQARSPEFICAASVNVAPLCVANEREGTPLICDGQVAGIFSAKPVAVCQEPMSYHEISALHVWINAASQHQLSLLSLIIVTVVTVFRNY